VNASVLVFGAAPATDPIVAKARQLDVSRVVQAHDEAELQTLGAFEAVVAVASAKTLVHLTPHLAAHISPRGFLVVSGYAPGDESIVAQALKSQPSLAISNSRLDRSWASLVVIHF
jgi:ribosomal protein L11 methylase PrmA